MRSEPAWRADLRDQVADLFRVKDGAKPEWTTRPHPAHAVADLVMVLIESHIKAAEQRGFSAASSKLGQTIRDLRYLIKVREDKEGT